MNERIFNGMRLTQICFGAYMIQFNFDDDFSISVADSLDYLNSEGQILKWNYKRGLDPISLNMLLEGVIRKATFYKKNNYLELSFQDKSVLTIKSGNDGNESYIINCKGDIQVVY